MSVRYLIGSCTVALVLSLGLTASLSGAGSDVADAVMRGNTAALKALLSQQADVNAPQSDGSTALHWAVYRSDTQTAELLIGAGANVKTATRDGVTPLSLASINGDAAMLSVLVKGGADPNEALPTGKTNLMLAARNGNPDAVKALLDAGAKIDAKESLRGTTALMWAADEGHSAAVKLLIDRGADITARSSATERGRGPALGKAGDPRRAVAAQGAARAANQASPDLNQLNSQGDTVALGGQGRGRGAAPNAQGNAQAGRGAAPAGAGQAQPQQTQAQAQQTQANNNDDDGGGRGRPAPRDGGELTALVYAARSNDIESARVLLDAGADVNQTTGYGWSPLLVATQNRHYKFAAFLLERGADPNLANKGGWVPLYLATDNRNIENGDYPVPKADMDHLEFITLLLDKGADVNHRVKDSTETRTVFTNQWLDENGATAFLRASQSSDLALMKLLLARGADPMINTVLNVTPLQVAAGIGWVDGITTEWSEAANVQAVKLLLDLGVDPNIQSDTGRTALHGASHKGRAAVVQMLVDHGGKLDIRDYGNTDNRGGKLAIHTWQAVDYADGLVRVGVQSAIAHPEAGLLIRKLMTAQGLEAPPMGRTLESICIAEACGE
ncbi:MAG TPA: ankyrin repeat domain-containing protein [Vicinamibacterales bacterium]|nr:ankyrin repeat domain-containing protein [Vicinamibacterales bacterium]